MLQFLRLCRCCVGHKEIVHPVLKEHLEGILKVECLRRLLKMLCDYFWTVLQSNLQYLQLRQLLVGLLILLYYREMIMNLLRIRMALRAV